MWFHRFYHQGRQGRTDIRLRPRPAWPVRPPALYFSMIEGYTTIVYLNVRKFFCNGRHIISFDKKIGIAFKFLFYKICWKSSTRLKKVSSLLYFLDYSIYDFNFFFCRKSLRLDLIKKLKIFVNFIFWKLRFLR